MLIGGVLGAGAAGAGGCAGPRWPAAGPLNASLARLRCAQSRGSRSAHYAASCVPCYWARDCAVPCGRALPLGRRRTRTRVGRSRVACFEVCAVSERAEWGVAASGGGWTSGERGAGWEGVCLPGAGGGHRGARCCCAGGVRRAGSVGGGGGLLSLARSLARSLSLSRSLARSLSLSLSPRTVRNGTRLRRSSLDKVGV